MYNKIMGTPLEVQIDWTKKDMMNQVLTGIEEFSVVESGEGKLLEFVKVVVNSTVKRLRVEEALDYFYHLQDTGEIRPGKDRIVLLIDYFIDWVGLELAKLYA
jgi:hypothetical protein